MHLLPTIIHISLLATTICAILPHPEPRNEGSTSRSRRLDEWTNDRQKIESSLRRGHASASTIAIELGELRIAALNERKRCEEASLATVEYVQRFNSLMWQNNLMAIAYSLVAFWERICALLSMWVSHQMMDILRDQPNATNRQIEFGTSASDSGLKLASFASTLTQWGSIQKTSDREHPRALERLPDDSMAVWTPMRIAIREYGRLHKHLLMLSLIARWCCVWFVTNDALTLKDICHKSSTTASDCMACISRVDSAVSLSQGALLLTLLAIIGAAAEEYLSHDFHAVHGMLTRWDQLFRQR